MTRRRRYKLKNEALNQLVESLVARAQDVYGETGDAELVRQMLVTGLRFMKDRTNRGDMKLVNSALKELRHSIAVFRRYENIRKVACFGSARTSPDHPDWKQAHEFAERIVSHGWMVITGAGDGIMGAAQGGAGREQSFGVNIRLPFEQSANEVIAGDKKLINFRYFFTRKVMFVKESHAIALFPGGFGTHDEGYEALTLMQTGKSEMIPMVYVDSPGGSYWKDWEEYVQSHLKKRGLISPEDLNLFRVTDSVDDAMHEILNFYSNYHSSRYVNGQLLMRMRHAPTEEELDTLNTEFPDILESGKIEACERLEQEEDHDADQQARITMHFNRRDAGRLRLLINRLNSFVTERESSAVEAARREIREEPMPPAAEEAEEAEDDE